MDSAQQMCSTKRMPCQVDPCSRKFYVIKLALRTKDLIKLYRFDEHKKHLQQFTTAFFAQSPKEKRGSPLTVA